MFLVAACDDPSAKPVRIGILLGVNSFAEVTEGFRAAILELGYVENQTVVFDEVSAQSDRTVMAQACEKFAASKVDLVFTTTNGGAIACKKALMGTDIPMVFAVVMAPVESGLVDNLEAPTGNITGVRSALQEYAGKRVELLHELAPDVARIWIPITLNYPTTKYFLPSVEAAAQSLGLSVRVTDVTTPNETIAYLDSLEAPDFDAIMIPPNVVPQAQKSLDAIMAYAQRHRLPVVGNAAKNLQDGCVMSYHIDNWEEGKIAGQMAFQILKDQERIPYPIIHSEPVLKINGKVAAELGLTISNDLRTLGSIIDE
ncbi:MAG: ABC transporter substrate-binding protein [Magnetospiraceae bacterium]